MPGAAHGDPVSIRAVLFSWEGPQEAPGVHTAVLWGEPMAMGQGLSVETLPRSAEHQEQSERRSLAGVSKGDSSHWEPSQHHLCRPLRSWGRKGEGRPELRPLFAVSLLGGLPVTVYDFP